MKVRNYLPLQLKTSKKRVKSSELVKIALGQGWKLSGQKGSHREYEKNGISLVIPFHGSKEVPTGTCSAILKIIKRVK